MNIDGIKIFEETKGGTGDAIEVEGETSGGVVSKP